VESEGLGGRRAFRKGGLARGKEHPASLKRGRDVSAVGPAGSSVCAASSSGLVVVLEPAVVAAQRQTDRF